jgi:hypothetical protein
MQGTQGQEMTVRTPAAVAVHETAATSAAALAKSRTEARITQALLRPRDLDDVRVKMLKECRRPGFAEVARYSIPKGGKKIEGPSIRFAEMAIRLMRNLIVESPTTYEDDEKRIMRVEVTDLEANSSYSLDLTVSKTVERKKLATGQTAMGTRSNSFGDQVYIVGATDDELAQKQAALVSKAIRTLALRLVPGDLIDEGMWVVLKTLNDAASGDPDAAKKKIADSFAALGVSPSMLAAYLGHELGASTPAELVDLRATYAALRDGEATWASITAQRDTAGGDEGAEAAVKAREGGGGRAAAAREAVKSRAQRKPIETTSEPAWDPATGEVRPEDEPA